MCVACVSSTRMTSAGPPRAHWARWTHLDEGLAAGAEEPVLERGDTQQRVNEARVQDVVVLAQLDRRLHRGIDGACSKHTACTTHHNKSNTADNASTSQKSKYSNS
jgi:hypothetical protein